MDLLKKLEKTQERYWNIDKETSKFLVNFIKKQGIKNILEVGTSNGYSALVFSEVVDKVVTIESWKERADEAKENCKGKNIEVIEGEALEVLDALEGSFDMAFLDAKKNEYGDYFRKCLRLVDKIIIADNVLSPKPEKMGDFFEAIKDYKHEIVEIGSGLAIIYL
jgi:predicted O-methyltransferase YrrM